MEDICLKIKEYFSALPEKKAFENAYSIAALLHEFASTYGYKKSVSWKEKYYVSGHVSSWGLLICSDPKGCTGRKNNSIFFALGKGYVAPNCSQMRELKMTMEQFLNLNVLKTLFALHGLTVSDFDIFVTADQVASVAFLKEEEVETALIELPLTVKEEEGI